MYKIAKHLAYLSLWRRKTRSLMVIMMIALSLAGLLGLQGLYDGMITHLINNSQRSKGLALTQFAYNKRDSSLQHTNHLERPSKVSLWKVSKTLVSLILLPPKEPTVLERRTKEL